MPSSLTPHVRRETPLPCRALSDTRHTISRFRDPGSEGGATQDTIMRTAPRTHTVATCVRAGARRTVRRNCSVVTQMHAPLQAPPGRWHVATPSKMPPSPARPKASRPPAIPSIPFAPRARQARKAHRYCPAVADEPTWCKAASASEGISIGAHLAAAGEELT